MFQRLYNYLRPQYALTWSFSISIERLDPQQMAIRRFLGDQIQFATPRLQRSTVRHWTPVMSFDDFPKDWAQWGTPFNTLINEGVVRSAVPYDKTVTDLYITTSQGQLVLTADMRYEAPTIIGWVAALPTSQPPNLPTSQEPHVQSLIPSRSRPTQHPGPPERRSHQQDHRGHRCLSLPLPRHPLLLCHWGHAAPQCGPRAQP